jgi:hypothetical protein
LVFPAAGIIGSILFPFGVSFLLPIFVVALVKEKEERIFVMMRINGLKQGIYYASHYITFFLLFLVSTLIFIGAGFLSNLELFTQVLSEDLTSRLNLALFSSCSLSGDLLKTHLCFCLQVYSAGVVLLSVCTTSLTSSLNLYDCFDLTLGVTGNSPIVRCW